MVARDPLYPNAYVYAGLLAMVASADANGDGEVSGEEFLVMMVPGTRADRE